MIHRATEDDCYEVAQLENLLFPENSMNEHTLRSILRQEKSWVLEGGEGYALVAWGPELIDVLRLGVMEDYRKKGWGQALLNAVLAEADMPVMLTVREDNAPAWALYKKLGFQLCGWLPNHKSMVLIRPTSVSR